LNVPAGTFLAHFYGPDQLWVLDASGGSFTITPDATAADNQLVIVADCNLTTPGPTWTAHNVNIQTTVGTRWELPASPGVYSDVGGATLMLPQVGSATYKWRYIKALLAWKLEV
jgi:hypothetical protein